MADVIIDTLLDTVKILPFLFAAYLLIEFLEHSGAAMDTILSGKLGKAAPVVGAVLGMVPQCGFSAAASNLYTQRIITGGTLLAVFLSTSDEMLPVMLSEAVPVGIIIKILAVKVISGTAVGLLFDLFFRRFNDERDHSDVHDICEREHCMCEEKGIFYSALLHTLKTGGFILLVSFILNLIIFFLGEERLAGMIMNRPVIGNLLASVVGLIPNCASSVVITQLYLNGALSAGAMISGLLSASGVGILVLFRSNRKHKGENLTLLSALFLSGAIIGIILDIAGLTF